MSITTVPEEPDDEWEDGPIDETLRDEPAPEMPISEELDAQLAKLEGEEGFDEPLIDDPGISPIPQESRLDEGLQTLEANEPFEPPAASSTAIEPISEPDSPDVSGTPGDDTLDPPATLQEFAESGGKFESGKVSLPGFPSPQQDGPMDPMKQYLDSGYSVSQLQSDFLMDHSAQLDLLTESMERVRL